MQVKEYIQQVYGYSVWANRRYLAVAENLTNEQLYRKQGHSWDTVHSVMVHMMSSETVWLRRWNGETPAAHLDPRDFPTLAVFRRQWDEVQSDVHSYIDLQTESSLQAEFTYTNFSGQTFHVPLWQMLMHVPNHETHHRGELAAMFALMQVPHPEDEVIQYFLDISGQKKA